MSGVNVQPYENWLQSVMITEMTTTEPQPAQILNYQQLNNISSIQQQ